MWAVKLCFNKIRHFSSGGASYHGLTWIVAIKQLQCCLFVTCYVGGVICQVEYRGAKHYRDAAGVVLSLTDAKGELPISRSDRSVVINNLVPKTPYKFHIRARFLDGTWGPRAMTQSETLADGVFDTCI